MKKKYMSLLLAMVLIVLSLGAFVKNVRAEDNSSNANEKTSQSVSESKEDNTKESQGETQSKPVTKPELSSVSVTAGDGYAGKKVTVTVTISGKELANVLCSLSYDSGLKYSSVSGASTNDGKTFTVTNVGDKASFTVGFEVSSTAKVGDSFKVTATATANGFTESNVDTVVIRKEETTPSENEPTTKESTTASTSKPLEVPVSSDTNLSSLSVSGYKLTPAFDPDVTRYTLTVPSDVSSIDIKATVKDSRSDYRVVGGKNLVEGENTVKVICTAEDGFAKTYTIIVTREVSASKDTTKATEEETKKTTSAKKNSSGGVPMWVTFLLCVVSMGIGFGICYCVFVGFNDPDDVNPSKKGNEKKTSVRKTGKNLNTSSENRLNDDKDTDDAELDLFDDDDDDKDELL